MTPDIREKAERLHEDLNALAVLGRNDELALISQALLEAHKAGRAEMKEGEDWQPIETAPKDGTAILVWMVGGCDVVRYSVPAEATTVDYAYPWLPVTQGEAYRADLPTHWRHLPAPPAIRSLP